MKGGKPIGESGGTTNMVFPLDISSEICIMDL
jgi:hypothetical protein